MRQSSEGNRWPTIDLEALEAEALEAGREWIRRYIEERLRQQAVDFSPDNGEKPPKHSTAGVTG
jgi:hypothetical protein